MVFDEKVVKLMIAKLAPALMMILTTVGGGLGFLGGSEGICKAAEYMVSTSFSLVPIIFITAPTIYTVIMFFMVYNKVPDSFEDCLSILSACIINGIACGMTGYSVGYSARVACVTRAQQKNFTTSYFLILIFGEAVGLLGFVCSVVITNEINK